VNATRERKRGHPLSAREGDVAKLLLAGLSNKEIGAELDLSEGTIKTHISNILAKLGARTRLDAVVKMSQPGARPLDALSTGERFIVDWQFELAGSFMHALAEAMSRADMMNLDRLMLGFPAEAAAMHNFKNMPGWWEGVLEKLGEIA
jgi:DNA-binding CsgD family transcriptional regulator